jgi:hypothetical protein
VVEAMAPPASDSVPQINVPATLMTGWTFEPGPPDAGHRLVPYDRDARAVDHQMRRFPDHAANIGVPRGRRPSHGVPFKLGNRALYEAATPREHPNV